MHRVVRDHLQASADYATTWYNKQVTFRSFYPGDRVRLYNAAHKMGKCPKWQFFYSDVGTVKQKLNDVTYIITCPKWRQINSH